VNAVHGIRIEKPLGVACRPVQSGLPAAGVGTAFLSPMPAPLAPSPPPKALKLMSPLDPANQVFLVGTTNQIDDNGPRAPWPVHGEDRGLRARRQRVLRLSERYLGAIPAAGRDAPGPSHFGIAL